MGERALRSRTRVESESEKVADSDAAAVTAAPQSDHEHSHLITQVTSALGFLDALDAGDDDVTKSSKQIQMESTSNGHESGGRTSGELRRPPPQFVAPPPPSDPPPPLTSSDDASSTCSECCHLQTYHDAPMPSKVLHSNEDEDAEPSIATQNVSNSKTEDFTAQSWLYRNVLQKQAEAREKGDALATHDAQRNQEGSEGDKNLTVAEFFKNSRLLAKSHFMKPDAITRRTVEVGKQQKILGERQLSYSTPFNKYQYPFMCVVMCSCTVGLSISGGIDSRTQPHIKVDSVSSDGAAAAAGVPVSFQSASQLPWHAIIAPDVLALSGWSPHLVGGWC